MHYVCIIKIKLSLEVTLASRKCQENKACGATVCDIKKCGHITELMFDIIEQNLSHKETYCIGNDC